MYDVTAIAAGPAPLSDRVVENYGNALGPNPNLAEQNDAFVYDYYSFVGGAGLDVANLYAFSCAVV